MKKKLAVLFTAAILALTSVFGFSGCNFLDQFFDGNPDPDTSDADDFLDKNGEEIEHTHAYSERVVAPDCIHDGYTVHTCACGHTYTDAIVPAEGHNFENYICTKCNDVEPNAPIANGLRFAPITDENEEITAYKVVGTVGLTSEAETIKIPDKLNGKPVTAISERVFEGCKMKSITIPDSVTEIGKKAFNSCINLLSVKIPDNVKVISENTFSQCKALTTVTLGNGTKIIKEYAFSECMALTQINLPNSLKEINRFAFWLDYGLAEISLPESLESIGDNAFAYCYALKSLNIPASVRYIGFGITEGCSELTKLTVSSGNVCFYAENNCVIETEHRTLTVGCSQSIIPDDDSVYAIGPKAFASLQTLTEITIPDSVTSIQWGAFFCCSNLETVRFGNGLGNIGNEAFMGDIGLHEITLPASVREIGEYAFADSGVGHIAYDYDITVADNNGYVADGLRAIRYMAFAHTPLTFINIPASVRVVEWAFVRTPLQTVRIFGDYEGESWDVTLRSHYVDYETIHMPEEVLIKDEETESYQYLAQLLSTDRIEVLVAMLKITPDEMNFTNYQIKRIIPGEDNYWW